MTCFVVPLSLSFQETVSTLSLEEIFLSNNGLGLVSLYTSLSFEEIFLSNNGLGKLAGQQLLLWDTFSHLGLLIHFRSKFIWNKSSREKVQINWKAPESFLVKMLNKGSREIFSLSRTFKSLSLLKQFFIFGMAMVSGHLNHFILLPRFSTVCVCLILNSFVFAQSLPTLIRHKNNTGVVWCLCKVWPWLWA